MSIVSISKAARLTSKSRTTIHRYIKTGKLSMCTDLNNKQGIDISELIRVFGEIKSTPNEQIVRVQNEHKLTQNETSNEHVKNEVLMHENKQLKKQIELLHDHVNSLKQAMLLLEHKGDGKSDKDVSIKKPWWKLFSN